MLGLIDHAAEKAGFYAVPAEPGKKEAAADEGPKPHMPLDQASAPATEPAIEEDGEFSVA